MTPPPRSWIDNDNERPAWLDLAHKKLDATTLVFTFTANNDFTSGSQVAITIPAGWTAPTTAAGTGHNAVASGTATLSGTPLGITGSTIFIDMANCTAGQYFTVTYSGVTAPSPASSPYAFTTQTDIGSGGQGLVNTTAPFPAVTVTPATLTVSAAGLTPNDKIYDGTNTATLVTGTPTPVAIISPDVVTLGTGGNGAQIRPNKIGLLRKVVVGNEGLVT